MTAVPPGSGPADPSATPPPPPAGAPAADAPPPPPETDGGPPADPGNPLRGSRTSGFWAGVVGVTVLLVLLIIFIAQNTADADVKFLWLSGSAPMAVLLLIAAVAGMIVVVLAGSLRILQLRRRVKRER